MKSDSFVLQFLSNIKNLLIDHQAKQNEIAKLSDQVNRTSDSFLIQTVPSESESHSMFVLNEVENNSLNSEKVIENIDVDNSTSPLTEDKMLQELSTATNALEEIFEIQTKEALPAGANTEKDSQDEFFSMERELTLVERKMKELFAIPESPQKPKEFLEIRRISMKRLIGLFDQDHSSLSVGEVKRHLELREASNLASRKRSKP